MPLATSIKEEQDNSIILRQITDHIIQCLNRIEDNIEHIVFIRRNSNIRNISDRFYIEQIDRFSRDTLIAFNHILDKDRAGSTLHSLILKIKDKGKRNKFELRLEKLRKDAELIIVHRNKVIAHHETSYNSKLGDWYPVQAFNYAYILNPCLCNKVHAKTAKLFWDLKYALGIDGMGMLHFAGGTTEKLFKKKALGARKTENAGLILFHKCRSKDCLLK
jgi:hypothetical protein